MYRLFSLRDGASVSWLKKSTAALLALSLQSFVALPAVLAQSAPVTPAHAASAPASNTAASATPQTNATSPSPTPAFPAPSAAQSAKARSLFTKGATALREQKSQRAMKYFAAAHRLDPGNAPYLLAYELARQQEIGGIVQLASQDQKHGDPNAAKEKLLAALDLDPKNPFVEEHLQSLATAEDPAVVEGTPMPRFSSGLIELEPAATKASFHLRATQQDMVRQVLSAYGITAVLDDSVQTKTTNLDLTDASFAQASTALQLATNTFLVPLDSRHALVARDTKENREKFERLLLETIFLPGLDEKEMTEPVNMIKTVFGVKQIASRADAGTISIRASEPTLRAINATLSRMYLDRPEMILDIRVFQLNDSRQQDLGVSFPQTLNIFNVSSEATKLISSNESTVQQLIAAGLVNPGDTAQILALLVGLGLVSGTVFNQPFALFGNGLTLSGLSFGSTTVNASLNISNTRELDHVQLRASDAQKDKILIGSKYPIITQSYSAGTQTPTVSPSLSNLINGATSATSAASTATNPLAYAPTVQYQDLGLSVETTPRMVGNGEIALALKIEIASLAGASVNGSPIINNRSFTTQVQVHDGSAAMIASSVSQTESRSLSGIPGLSELPGFAWTASPTTQVNVGKLLIVITPRIISATHTSVATRMLPVSIGNSTP